MSDTTTTDRLLAEGVMGMGEAARVIEELYSTRGGKRRPTHPSTPLRWATRGHLLPDGKRIKLEAVRIAKRWHTSRAAILRFIECQQPVTDATPAIRSVAQRERDHAATMRDLEAEGAV